LEVPARLWTSGLKRSILTARHIKQSLFIMQDGYPFTQMMPRVFKNLDEIYAGACDGMTCVALRKGLFEVGVKKCYVLIVAC